MKKIICAILAAVFILNSLESMKAYAANDAEEDFSKIEAYTENEIVKAELQDATPDTPEIQGETLNVLMVGNSFTRHKANGVTYSVGKTLKELAAGEGHKMKVTMLVHGGAYLRRYAGLDGAYISYYTELIELLTDNKWDYIILQEQSKSPIQNFDDYTYPAVEKLLKMIKVFQPQATPLLYMTHGFNRGTTTNVNGVSKVLSANEMQIYLAASYRTLEHKLNVEAVPVGMHFRRANYYYPGIDMLGEDSWHPSYAGYYLAACSFYQKIYGTTPNPAKASLTNCNLTKQELVSLASLTSDSMKLNKTDITMAVGRTQSLSAAVFGRHYGAITYQSLNKNVADVNINTGKVTAKGYGNTVVMASTPDGLQAFCNVTVRKPLCFARSYYLAGIGDKIQIMPQTNVSNLKWTSSKKKVATVSEGVVTVKASGKTVITVTNQDDTKEQASYVLYVACDAPKGLKTVLSGNPDQNAAVGKIKVSWNAVTGAAGYDVYRSTSKKGTYIMIGSSKKEFFIDKQAKINKKYFYKITAKNRYKQCTSELSDYMQGIVLQATSLEVKCSKRNYAKLKWQKNAKATGYVVYRSTKANSGYKKIAKLKSKAKTSYTDRNVKKDKDYYYKIKAYKEVDGNVILGAKCEEVKIRIDKNM